MQKGERNLIKNALRDGRFAASSGRTVRNFVVYRDVFILLCHSFAMPAEAGMMQLNKHAN
ncbi:hypothetical protein [Aquicella lusitana]|uniref:Uncharacterized protein n=1 Tax=Aquicella lusitana TaxID=254246 RepID=A0A370GM09_9COXI|nr:hypothetical protein [Aquicella lusitana]RDI44782.1 hypothetical protein C8D86_10834 [Aquicella lusitana]VVC72979.1 hypothetical protein AQULUS_07050 [Aquicella lusitana]